MIVDLIRILQMVEIIFPTIIVNYEISKRTLGSAAFNYWTKALCIRTVVEAPHPSDILVEATILVHVVDAPSSSRRSSLIALSRWPVGAIAGDVASLATHKAWLLLPGQRWARTSRAHMS